MRWLFEACKTTKKWPNGRYAPVGPPICSENLKVSQGKPPLEKWQD